MARIHCQACKGEFGSLYAFDKHLILYKDVEFKPWNGYEGRPVCLGQKWGRPMIDPNLVRMRASAARLRGRKPAPVKPQRPSELVTGSQTPDKP